MDVAGGAELVAGSLMVILVGAIVAGVAAVWWATHRARRWYRRLLVTLTGEIRQGGSTRVMAGFASVSVTDVSWWMVQRDRHRMWRAVTSAERAVAAAVAADAPTGDLAALTRRLRRTAESVDAALLACGRSAANVRPVRQQVTDLVRAAGQVQNAAVDALTAVAQPATVGLADAVVAEVAALRHGLTTMSSSLRR